MRISTTEAMGVVVDETASFLNAFIGEIAEAPTHLVDNEFIRRGYRIGYHRSIKSILRSLFEFHNESINVWSHLLGMFFFGSLIFYTLYQISNIKEVSSYIWNDLH